MSWFETTEGIVSLAVSGFALISAIVALAFKLYDYFEKIKANKDWKKIEEIAKNAMVEIEASGLTGEEKKKYVCEMVFKACNEIEIDFVKFKDTLDEFIDDCISFANTISTVGKTIKKKK